MDKINITLKPNQKIWFTSDPHFGHRNILTFCKRPFQDVKEMNKSLIDYWNNTVGKDEIVFCLGDFFWFHGRHDIKKIINQLNGHIYLVPGNHDDKKSFELCDPEKLTILSDIVYLYIRPEKSKEDDLRFECNCYEIILSHFPQLCYSHSQNKNTYNFFGHIHTMKGQLMMEFGSPIFIPNPGRQFDVGMDSHDYRPVEFFQVLREIKEYPWKSHKNSL